MAAGVHLRDGVTATTVRSTIIENAGRHGGGLAVSGAAVTLIDTELGANLGQVQGGGLFGAGAASITVAGGRIGTNDAGAGSGGGIYLQDQAVGSFTGVQIDDNDASASGGGLHHPGTGSVTLDRVQLTDNEAAGSGGGLATQGPLTVTNSTIASNSAGVRGGGVSTHAAPALRTVLRNVTVSGNLSPGGAGVAASGSIQLASVSVVGKLATTGAAGIATDGGDPSSSGAPCWPATGSARRFRTAAPWGSGRSVTT